MKLKIPISSQTMQGPTIIILLKNEKHVEKLMNIAYKMLTLSQLCNGWLTVSVSIPITVLVSCYLDFIENRRK